MAGRGTPSGVRGARRPGGMRVGMLLALLTVAFGIVAFGGSHKLIALVIVAVIVGSVALATGFTTTLDVLVVLSPLMFFRSGSTLHLSAADAVLPVMALDLSVRSTRRRSIRLDGWVVLYVTALLAVILASALAASASAAGFSLSLGVANILKMTVAFAYMTVVSTHVAATPLRETARALRVWGWTAALMAAGSVLWELGGPGLVPHDSERSNGFFQDPNLYAAYLLLSLAVVLAREAMGHVRETPLLLVLVCSGVFTTASRSAAATLAALVVIAALTVRMRVVRVVFGCVGAVGLGLIIWGLTNPSAVSYLPALNRFTNATQQSDNEFRLLLWSRGFQLWQDHPVLGVGIGQFGRYTEDIGGVLNTGAGYVAHNTFISFLAETGTIGIALCLAGFLAIYTVAKRHSSRRESVRSALAVGVLAVVLQMLTLNLQNVRYVWIYFGVVIGLAACHSRSPDAGGPTADARSGPTVPESTAHPDGRSHDDVLASK